MADLPAKGYDENRGRRGYQIIRGGRAVRIKAKNAKNEKYLRHGNLPAKGELLVGTWGVKPYEF